VAGHLLIVRRACGTGLERRLTPFCKIGIELRLEKTVGSLQHQDVGFNLLAVNEPTVLGVLKALDFKVSCFVDDPSF